MERTPEGFFLALMQTDCPSPSQLLVVGDEALKAFNTFALGDTNDYLWKEFQGSVQVSFDIFQGFDEMSYFGIAENLQKCWPGLAGFIQCVVKDDIGVCEIAVDYFLCFLFFVSGSFDFVVSLC